MPRECCVDLLSSILRELRFESAGYRWLELGAPYRVRFDHPGLRGVHLITHGECELGLEDGTVLELVAGDMVIFPHGDFHVLRARNGAECSTVSSFDLAMRTPGTRLRAGGDSVDTIVVCGAFVVGEPDHPALRAIPRIIHVPGDRGRPLPWIAPLIDALAAEAFDAGPGSDLIMARLSDALLIRALRHQVASEQQSGWLAGLRDPQVATALALLHADLAQQWTLPLLAAKAGLSRAAFAARFTASVGESPMRYLLLLRLQRAKSLMRNPAATIATVAGQVGYQSDVAFATAFKREVGVPPGAYRRRVDHPGPAVSPSSTTSAAEKTT